MLILGLGYTDHEASAALVRDGSLVVAIARERLSRVKRDGISWGTGVLNLSSAITYCLDAVNLTLADVDLIVWSHIQHDSPAKVGARIWAEGGLDLSAIPAVVLPHHFAHACCSFYLSPFPDAAVLIVDGQGGPVDRLTQTAGPDGQVSSDTPSLIQRISSSTEESGYELESFYHFADGQHRLLRKVIGASEGGIGGAYGRVSTLIFGDCLDAGKTMGLAPFGEASGRMKLLEPSVDGDRCSFISFRTPSAHDVQTQLRSWRNPIGYRLRKKLRLTSGPNRAVNYLDPLPVAAAATIQHETEAALLSHARWLHQHTNSKNLCLGGGVALNCVANSRLAQDSGFENIFVPSAPGDDGIAVGCALYGAAVNHELKRELAPVSLGRSYGHTQANMVELGLAPVAVDDLNQWAAEKFATGAVIAWYQGGAELGPRALGYRSLLADPRDPQMRDYLNRVVKRREMFRPFAPVVLAESVLDYFEQSFPSRFMSFVATVRSEKRALLPAITHVDGTARYQVLNRMDNPALYELISAFGRLTGLPMLLNTSFNRAGEPIVETPTDAAHCMLASDVDYLVLDGSAYEPARRGRSRRERRS